MLLYFYRSTALDCLNLKTSSSSMSSLLSTTEGTFSFIHTFPCSNCLLSLSNLEEFLSFLFFLDLHYVESNSSSTFKSHCRTSDQNKAAAPPYLSINLKLHGYPSCEIINNGKVLHLSDQHLCPPPLRYQHYARHHCQLHNCHIYNCYRHHLLLPLINRDIDIAFSATFT
jgi:hypothetical protein